MSISSEKSISERELVEAVNASCSCGGGHPDDGCCLACEVWHRVIDGWTTDERCGDD